MDNDDRCDAVHVLQRDEIIDSGSRAMNADGPLRSRRASYLFLYIYKKNTAIEFIIPRDVCRPATRHDP